MGKDQSIQKESESLWNDCAWQIWRQASGPVWLKQKKRDPDFKLWDQGGDTVNILKEYHKDSRDFPWNEVLLDGY